MDFFNSIPWAMLIWSVAKAVFVIFCVVLPMVSYTVYAERRVSAAIQDRVGPNRTGFPTTLLGFKKDLQLFLGGIRSTSQMIAYELSMGMSIIPVLMAQQTMQMSHIVQNQADHGWTLLPLWGDGLSVQRWLLMLPFVISFIIFTISVFAETNRLPFDLPESETELVAGYHTEYSSMKFALFFLGEYTAMIVGSSLIVVFFLGGWHMPGIPDGNGNGGFAFLQEWANADGGGWLKWVFGFLNITCFFGKVAALLVFFIWVRWTLPRFRFDQLMKIGWLYLFEIALANIFLTAAIIAFTSK